MSKKAINATHYELIPTFPSRVKRKARIVNAVIETPKGSRQKYALHAGYGIIAFHDILPEELHWPYDYGFIPQTLAADGDPLDVLLVNENGLFSGCLIEARIIGTVRETKDGTENDRLIGVPLPSPGAPAPTDAYRDIADLPRHTLDDIKRFLTEYSARQGHRIRVKAIAGADEAMQSVKATCKAFKKNGRS
ncbi:MAG: inorganic diphosphatase [Candidatus Eremiobacteraeota bacterium]|nr:inorganic diphosphatase [Candidatus Eremiobacteraeota bacterium]